MTAVAPAGPQSDDEPPSSPPGLGPGDEVGGPGNGARLVRLVARLGVFAVCGLLAWHLVVRTGEIMRSSTFMAAYTILIGGYVLSRFVLAALYRAPRPSTIEPTVAVIVPAYNEGAAIARTIAACSNQTYPAEKVEIICVDDGSADDTWVHMNEAAAAVGPRVRCIALGHNQGKRAAMAAGYRASTAEILVFVDSDSMPAVDGIRRIVDGFGRRKVGAVAGLTHARNAEANALTRMQAARYYVSYQLLKSAESVVGAVACCSGCFSAYRREALDPVMATWEHQRFLGVECTYGDDRSLTNMVLRDGWHSIYHSKAEAWTEVPETYRVFFRQQLRWKKSWVREGPILMTHIWRHRPLAFPAVLIATLAGLISPIVVMYNVVWSPVSTAAWPVVYGLGLFLVAMGYGLLHRSMRDGANWVWAVIGTFFYLLFSAQVIWAVLRVRDGSWGTRGA